MIKGPKSGRCQLHGDRARLSWAKDLMLILVFASFTQPYLRFYCLQAQCKVPPPGSEADQTCLRNNSSAKNGLSARSYNSGRCLFNLSYILDKVGQAMQYFDLKNICYARLMFPQIKWPPLVWAVLGKQSKFHQILGVIQVGTVVIGLCQIWSPSLPLWYGVNLPFWSLNSFKMPLWRRKDLNFDLRSLWRKLIGLTCDGKLGDV